MPEVLQLQPAMGNISFNYHSVNSTIAESHSLGTVQEALGPFLTAEAPVMAFNDSASYLYSYF